MASENLMNIENSDKKNEAYIDQSLFDGVSDAISHGCITK